MISIYRVGVQLLTVLQNLIPISKFKTSFVREPYLHILKTDNLRKHMTAVRTVSHKLEIETGRYTNTPRIDRKCKLCSMNVVESEFHFLLICPKYNILRRLYVPHRAWPTLQYFHKLLSSENKKTIINTAKFIMYATQCRDDAIIQFVIMSLNTCKPILAETVYTITCDAS